MSELDKVFDEIVKYMDKLYEAREKVLLMVRNGIRDCAKAINLIHLREFRDAYKMMEGIKNTYRKVRKEIERNKLCETIAYNFYQEYVEAYTFYGVLVDGKLYDVGDLEVSPVPYVLGLCDMVGELRRYVLNLIKDGDIEGAEKLSRIMLKINDNLNLMVYPDSMIPGLKRKKDVVRGLVEKTLSDITNATIFGKGRSSVEDR
ncbi:MAG: hypothetical protein J7L50_01500 [Candidatus Odinarchaeota archaeon]|nr:hypothetical protein [Candidatus Odinarchaeota archaeon]